MKIDKNTLRNKNLTALVVRVSSEASFDNGDALSKPLGFYFFPVSERCFLCIFLELSTLQNPHDKLIKS
jgi:hypothetical protein